VKRAAEAQCAVKILTRDDAQQETAARIVGDRAVRSDGEIRTDDDKYYLSRTPLSHVPLTPLQAARVNAIVGTKGDPLPLLTPAQRALLERIRAEPDAGWPDAIGVGLREAWQRIAETEEIEETGEEEGSPRPRR